MSDSLRTMADAKEALRSILATLASSGSVVNHGSEARYQLTVVSLLIRMCGLKMNQIDVETKFHQNGGVDVALFSDDFIGDFNVMGNSAEMIKNVRMLIEIKSLLVNGKNTNTRLNPGPIKKDIQKLVETRKFLTDKGTNVATALIVFDTTEHDLRITDKSLSIIVETAKTAKVDFIYFTSDGLITIYYPDHQYMLKSA